MVSMCSAGSINLAMLTGIVRDPVATCGISVIASAHSVDRGLLTPIRAPMSDAATVSQNDITSSFERV